MKPEILIVLPFPSEEREQLSRDYVVHYAPTADERARILASSASRIVAVATNGSAGLTRAEILALPALRIVHALGAGLDAIDLPALRERNVVLTSGSGTNANLVADHALGLALALIRRVVEKQQGLRAGNWDAVYTPSPILTGKRVGILGLGAIGMAIARRAAAFETTIAYHNRKPRQDVAHRYFASPTALAAEFDVLFLAAPGGDGTRHIVNAEVLEALGPRGYLVNVGRGSVVDTDALVRSLNAGGIAGAALDVFEGEPNVPAGLRTAPNLLLTPHIGGYSPEALAASNRRLFVNLAAFFAGRPLESEVRLPT